MNKQGRGNISFFDKNIRFLRAVFLSRLKKTPYKLNFAVTSACNANCLTCNVGRNYRRNPQLVKNELQLNQIEKIFTQLPDTITWLSFSGGEPFLKKDFVEIIKLALEKLPNLSVINIPSNGLNTKAIVNQVKKILEFYPHQFFINFSLDGPPRVHNQIRGVSGGYDRTWKTYLAIKKIAKSNPNFRVNLEITISRFNINHLSKFVKQLIDKGEKITVTIAHDGFLYKNQGKRSFTINEADLTKIKEVIKIVSGSLSLFNPAELVEKLYLRKIPQFIKKPKEQPLPCTALKASCALDPFGNVTPCFMLGTELGNLGKNNFNLMTILRKKRTLKTKTKINQGACTCWTPCEAYQSIIWTFLTARWYRFNK